MKRGDIVLIPFPFVDISVRKVRPAVILNFTSDKHEDLIVCAISSVVPEVINDNEIVIDPSSQNNLKVRSIVKPDRIITLRQDQVIDVLGNLSTSQFDFLKKKLQFIFS